VTTPCTQRRPVVRWPPLGPWYGTDPAWRIPLEARARRRFGSALHVNQVARQLRYVLDGVDVRGRAERVPVRVVFWADPRWDPEYGDLNFGLRPQDYPSVYADSGALSKHRMPDDGLCLYCPRDPPERRWQAEQGLDVLFDLVAEHLVAEDWWRDSGGEQGGEWVLDEAPHVLADRQAR